MAGTIRGLWPTRDRQVDVARVSRIRGTRCTVELAGGAFCDAPSAEDVPFPICGLHAARLFRHVVDRLEGRTADRLGMLYFDLRERTKRTDEAAHRARAVKPKVYYVQVGEYIKIGYTKRLRERMTQYPPHKRLLATEDGGRDREVERHNQFAGSLAQGKEWFRPTPDLIDHINQLRAKLGSGPITMAR